VASMWDDGGRLRMRADTVDLTDYGDELTPAATMAAGGPVDGSGPGDLTRWLGTPWQCDAASCRSGYQPAQSVVLPTFWPARIPNHVLREADYRKVVDTKRPMAERDEAFRSRYDWERFVAAPDQHTTLRNMIDGWWKLGLVEERPGPTDGKFPRVMKVEADLGFTAEPTTAYGPTYAPLDPSLLADPPG
jgi:L-lysine epsilon oxidase C-terminal domain